jgi:PGF-pre-PGF domain-containing protein
MRPFAKNVTMSSIQGIVKISFCISLLVLAVTLSAAGGSSSGNSTESTYNVTAAPIPVTEITVTGAGDATEVVNGETLQMSASVLPLDATDPSVTWSVTAGTGTATINETGLLTATGDGTVTVKATANDGSAIEGTLVITVTAAPIPVTGITVTGAGDATEVVNGETLQMSASVLPLDATDPSVTWSVVAGTGTATINEAGLLTGTGDGTVTVKATANDGSDIEGTLVVTVTAAPIPVTGITVTGAGDATEVVNGETLQMSASVLPLDATDPSVTWSVVAGTGTATINEAGLLTGTAVGTVTVKATSKDGSNIAGIYNITVSEAQSTTTPTTGGGGGGGGGQSTGEKYENIELKDYSIKYVLRDTETMFEFTKEGNSIVGLGFTARLNGGQTKTVIEMLKGTSTMVNKAAPGTVYKNVNIWVGDGKTTPDLLSDARIMFKVEKAWIAGNSIDPASIRMLRYNSGSWAQLPTSRTGEDETYVYYIAQTPGFSAFAISSIGKEEQQVIPGSNQQGSSSQSGESAQMSTEDSQTPQAGNAVSPEAKSSGSFVFLLILVGISALGVLGYRYKDQLSQVRAQLGNPDGKRYRRFKRS